MVIWWKFSTVSRFFLDTFPLVMKWWRKSRVQWIMWKDLTVPWVIRSVLISLIFTQHANDNHPDDYLAAHLCCYLWCLLVYLLFCLATSPFFSDGWSGVMVRWFMMVQRLWRDIFVAEILPSAICDQQLLEWIPPPGTMFQVIFPGTQYNSWEAIFLVDVRG